MVKWMIKYVYSKEKNTKESSNIVVNNKLVQKGQELLILIMLKNRGYIC